MRITYLDHSGFFVEGEEHCLLFDYYRGTLPKMPAGKTLTVFVSHHHPDHLTREAFAYGESVPGTYYFLGSDVTLNAGNRANLGIDDGMFARCIRVHRDDRITKNGVTVFCLRSNDMGAAFFVECEGKALYHGGDHNEWIWHKDASFDKAQVEHYFFEIEKLRLRHIDAAFLPLDPRLGDEYWRGFDAFARLLEPDLMIPMHMVGEYGLIGTMKNNPVARAYRDRIAEIRGEGDMWEI